MKKYVIERSGCYLQIGESLNWIKNPNHQKWATKFKDPFEAEKAIIQFNLKNSKIIEYKETEYTYKDNACSGYRCLLRLKIFF